MNFDQYAVDVGGQLRTAYNTKNGSAVSRIVADADAALRANAVDAPNARLFWAKVRREFKTGQRLVEKQENSALLALMRDIEAALAARS